jgi:hypothetical protein
MEHGRGEEGGPNFTLPHFDAITESNWEEYNDQGFGVLWADIEEPKLFESLWETAKRQYGVANVFSGDAFDFDSERPLRHKPGTAIYVSPAGFQYKEEYDRRNPGLYQSPVGDEPAES